MKALNEMQIEDNKMKHLLIIYLLLITSFAFSQGKEQEFVIDKKLKECLDIDTNQTTLGMIQCTNNAADEWDKELNKNYKLLMGILSEEERAKLKESQRKWIEFRDKEFEFSGTMYYNLQGTLWRITAADRRYDLIRQRAIDLKNYYQILTENR